MTAAEVGSARAEGIRLFKLAGRPDKLAFQLVYGPKGHSQTWVARAKAKGYASAEEAAQRFQDDLTQARVNLTDKAGIATKAGQ